MLHATACSWMLVVLVSCSFSPRAIADDSGKPMPVDLGCLDGRTPVKCLVAPCQTQACKDKCAAMGKDTQCVDNYCGGCNCDCVTPSTPQPSGDSTCPNGQPRAMCFVEPCATDACKKKCAALGLADSKNDYKCVDNYCGGCKCDCVPTPKPTSPCPNGEPVAKCFQAPCATDACKKKCALLGLKDSKNDYKCVDNYCGGCKCDCVPTPKPTPGPQCPAGQPPARCTQAPCATEACKQKCAAAVPKGFSVEVKCLDNYCGGCNCDCCLARNNICTNDGPLKDLKCCPGTICAFSNACMTNPFAKCGTVCIPKEEAADFCKKEHKQCDPKKLQCCSGTSCQRWGKGKSKQYKCQKCKFVNAKCSLSKQDCCNYLSCQKKAGATYATCQPAHLG